jgi:hypothetical protein
MITVIEGSEKKKTLPSLLKGLLVESSIHCHMGHSTEPLRQHKDFSLEQVI